MNPSKLKKISETGKLWRKNNKQYSKNWWKKYYKRNLERIRRWKHEYYLRNKKKISKKKQYRKYGLTSKEYNYMLKAQRYRCAICRKKFVITPSVDHCHKTNKVRGLLCVNCNVGIGRLKDNKRILRNAISYLARS